MRIDVGSSANFALQIRGNDSEVFRVAGDGTITSTGKLLLGTTTEGVSTADDLTIATSGNTGITIRSGTSSNGNIFFADGTTGNAELEGFIQYDHSANYMRFATGATERLRIDSSGRLLLGTTTEGYTSADDFTVETTGHTGITIRSGTTSLGTLAFSDGTSGSAEFDGYIQYDQDNRHMDFATGGGNIRLRIDSSGNVGIGTTSPSDVLEISHASDPAIRFHYGSNSGYSVIKIDSSNNLTFGIDSTSAGSNSFCNFKIDGSEKLRIDSSGRVGIGTTSPDDRLVLSGSTGDGLKLIDGTHVVVFRTVSGGGILKTASNHDLVFGTNDTERFRLDSSGSLLLGVTSAHPVASNHDPKFLVSGTSFASCLVSQQRFENNAAGPTLVFAKSRNGTQNSHTIVQDGDELGKIRFYGSDGNDFQNYGAEMAIQVDGTPGNNDMPGRFIFKTTKDGNSSSSERMAIMSKGRIVSLVDDTDSVGVLHKRHQGSNSHNFFEIRSSGTSLLSGGTLQFAIETDGDVKNTNNSYSSLSDIKLKENIVDAKSQWDDIKALKIRNYNFKSELDYGTYTQIGLIAQEVEETSPGLVVDNIDRDDEGKDLGTVTKTLRYSVLHIKALKALQEAMAKIETLETKVAALEAK